MYTTFLVAFHKNYMQTSEDICLKIYTYKLSICYGENTSFSDFCQIQHA